jgi:hypothetical protein
MGLVVLILLGLAWAVVLVPSIRIPRMESSPLSGVRNFEHTMGILANTRATGHVPGRWVVMPRSPESVPGSRRARVIARRRRTFERLLLAAATTLVLALIPGLRGMFWVHAMLDLVVVAYVMQLKRWRIAERTRLARARAAERAERIAAIEAQQIAEMGYGDDRLVLNDDTQPVRRVIVLDDLEAVAG